MKIKVVLAIICSLSFVICTFGQTSANLVEILNQTEKQAAFYQETFRNLLAVETKTFVDFDKNEQEKKRKIVEADFLVYQSSKNPKISFELRNVKSVDGKPIPNGQTNSDRFFAELNKSSTLKSQLEKIQKTSSKYDKNFDISGLTLYEGIILSLNLRSVFQFELAGKENLQGREVYLVNYWQTKESPFISINGKGTGFDNPSLEFEVEMSGGMKKTEFFLRGKFWIDVESFQIWREERELVAQGAELLVLLRTDFEYQPSNFGILVPRQINLLTNQIKKKDGKFITVKDSSIIFDYSKFRKTETDVKILDDSEN